MTEYQRASVGSEMKQKVNVIVTKSVSVRQVHYCSMCLQTEIECVRVYFVDGCILIRAKLVSQNFNIH